MDILPFPVMLIHKDRTLISVNKAAAEMGVVPGSFCWDTFGKRQSIPTADRDYFEQNGQAPPNGTCCDFCRADTALLQQKTVREKIDSGTAVFDTFWIPVTADTYLHYAVLMP